MEIAYEPPLFLTKRRPAINTLVVFVSLSTITLTNQGEQVDNFHIAGTGSRQLVLNSNKHIEVRNQLVNLLAQAKVEHGDSLVVISGMAEGFDEALALAAIQANVPFIAAIPNKTYIQYYWGTASILERDRTPEAQDILSKAQEIVYVCPGVYGNDGRHSNFHRNEWMVDHANVVWVYNPTTRGTAQCYA